MPTYLTTASGAQDGWNLNTANWIDTTAFLRFGILYKTGLQFQIHNQFNAAGQILDPPLVHSTFDLTFNTVNPIGVPALVAVSFVAEVAPAPYSTVLEPGTRGETPLVTTFTSTANQIVITIPTTSIVPVIKQAAWNGIISLTIIIIGAGVFDVHSAESATPTLAPSITTTEARFFTGIDNHGVEMGRPVRDMKTGLPLHVPDLTEDGYSPGIWTKPSQFDPVDPRDERPVEFPSNEGTWEDDNPAS